MHIKFYEITFYEKIYWKNYRLVIYLWKFNKYL